MPAIQAIPQQQRARAFSTSAAHMRSSEPAELNGAFWTEPEKSELEVVTTVDGARSFRSENAGGRIGLVPTMGGLHEGHIALMKAAQEVCDKVVVSLFVNPKQFGPNEDFLTYPRPLERDLELLHAAQVDAVFLPGVEEMYSTRFATVVDLQGLEDISGEAKSRPGFFRGVATVCTKLFNIVQPDAVFFGQKDAMQCTVIRRIVQDLDMPIAVHVCPTHREHDGLAFSTRNAYLQEADRAAAPVLFRALSAAMAYYDANPAISRQNLVDVVQDTIRQEPLAGAVEYISLSDPETGAELKNPCAGAVLSAVVQFGPGGEKVRILDNVVLSGAAGVPNLYDLC